MYQKYMYLVNVAMSDNYYTIIIILVILGGLKGNSCWGGGWKIP